MEEPRYSTEPEDPIGFTQKHDRFYTVSARLYDAAVRRLPVWKTWLEEIGGSGSVHLYVARSSLRE